MKRALVWFAALVPFLAGAWSDPQWDPYADSIPNDVIRSAWEVSLVGYGDNPPSLVEYGTTDTFVGALTVGYTSSSVGLSYANPYPFLRGPVLPPGWYSVPNGNPAGWFNSLAAEGISSAAIVKKGDGTNFTVYDVQSGYSGPLYLVAGGWGSRYNLNAGAIQTETKSIFPDMGEMVQIGFWMDGQFLVSTQLPAFTQTYQWDWTNPSTQNQAYQVSINGVQVAAGIAGPGQTVSGTWTGNTAPAVTVSTWQPGTTGPDDAVSQSPVVVPADPDGPSVPPDSIVQPGLDPANIPVAPDINTATPSTGAGGGDGWPPDYANSGNQVETMNLIERAWETYMKYLGNLFSGLGEWITGIGDKIQSILDWLGENLGWFGVLRDWFEWWVENVWSVVVGWIAWAVGMLADAWAMLQDLPGWFGTRVASWYNSAKSWFTWDGWGIPNEVIVSADTIPETLGTVNFMGQSMEIPSGWNVIKPVLNVARAVAVVYFVGLALWRIGSAFADSMERIMSTPATPAGTKVHAKVGVGVDTGLPFIIVLFLVLGATAAVIPTLVLGVLESEGSVVMLLNLAKDAAGNLTSAAGAGPGTITGLGSIPAVSYLVSILGATVPIGTWVACQTAPLLSRITMFPAIAAGQMVMRLTRV